MFDRITEIALLYDFYGQLLTKRQQEVMRLYHEENYSLSEIAEEFSISRQGVHDALKNAGKALSEYEEKLGLIKRFSESREAIDLIEKKLDCLAAERKTDKALSERLTEIKEIIDGLEL